MLIKVLNKTLQVKNVFYLYIVAYMFSVAANPETSSARYITSITDNNTFVRILCYIAAMSGMVGIILRFKPIRFWLLCIPFIAYCFMTAYVLLTTGDPKAWAAIVSFIMYILLAITLTWEKINAMVR